MKNLLLDLLSTIPDGQTLDVRIGLHWTAVVVQTGGETRCGLASTLSAGHEHGGEADVPQAGQLELCSGRELAEMALHTQLTLRSVGIAAINALLPQQPSLWSEANAEEVIASRGAGKRVVLVGHFPFVSHLRPRVGELIILEQSPVQGDLPAVAAPDVVPEADVVAITSMTLLNHTLEGLLSLCSPQAQVIMLGPSTPLSPVLFDYGVAVLSGSVVTAIEPVLRTVSQAGNFRQVHHAGVRLVNLTRPS